MKDKYIILLAVLLSILAVLISISTILTTKENREAIDNLELEIFVLELQIDALFVGMDVNLELWETQLEINNLLYKR